MLLQKCWGLEIASFTKTGGTQPLTLTTTGLGMWWCMTGFILMFTGICVRWTCMKEAELDIFVSRETAFLQKTAESTVGQKSSFPSISQISHLKNGICLIKLKTSSWSSWCPLILISFEAWSLLWVTNGYLENTDWPWSPHPSLFFTLHDLVNRERALDF